MRKAGKTMVVRCKEWTGLVLNEMRREAEDCAAWRKRVNRGAATD